MVSRMQQRHAWMLPGAIALQALGLAIWWEWFNAFAFGSGSAGWGVFKTILIAGVLSLWAWGIPLWASKKLGWDAGDYRWRDTLAGMPLAFLPLLIPFQALFTSLSKPFAMHLTAFVWMPWWFIQGRVLKPEAYTALMAAGVLIMAAMVVKVSLALISLNADAGKATAKRLFVIGFLAYLLLLSWPACVSAPQSGETSQLLVLQAMVGDSHVSVENVLGRADYYTFHPLQAINFSGYSDDYSRMYLLVAPGFPLVALAFFSIQGRWLAAVLVMLFAAGAASQLFGLCRDQGFSQRSSFWVWLLALLNAPLFLYGYQMYEVTGVAFFMLWGLRKALQINADSKTNRSSAAAAGLAAGLICLVGLRFIIPAGLIMAMVVQQANRASQRGAMLAGFGIMAIPALCAVSFYLSVYTVFIGHFPYHLNMPWQPGAWVNALALLGDRYAGLVWNAPVWLLALGGCLWLWNQGRRSLTVITLLPILAMIPVALVFPDSRAEGSSFNRFLAPVIPLLGLGLAAFLDAAEQKSIWLKVTFYAGLWGAVLVLAQLVFPFLSVEASRLKLADMVKALGWIYTVLPSVNSPAALADILFGAVLTAVGLYVVYAVWDYLNNLPAVVAEKPSKPPLGRI
jgi:uncharacterized membrane protein